MRIISICPSNTELCVFLGVQEQLIAVDDFSDWPESIISLPRLGPDLSIDMERTESLKPDLVLASLSVPGMERNIEELQKRNIPHVVLNPQSLDDIAEDLHTVGKLLGIEELAAERIRVYKSLISTIKEISDTITERPSLYWEWWPKPIFTPGKINWLTEISRLAGAQNLFQDVELASVQTSDADVAERNPDVICLAWVGVPLRKVQPGIVKKRPGWDRLNAIKNDSILVLEEPLYCRPSPRLLDGLIKLAKILHPEKYRDINSDGLWNTETAKRKS
ncbi:cobalamin-binding protein [Peribacillus deserti]|uniref:Cobalamin-binding protein n=1 Tax=Peribacillus deserti TaxID=673318 RepID=A0A2N5M7J7_9BACI|nr:cobalamin-binding protein [Peribacillus deserti]PLT30329.1 cobalamin-binding protein [Peribacillus deserti]